MPEWLPELIAGTALGLVAKLALDFVNERRQNKTQRQAQLNELAELLKQSRSIYLDQNFKARKLLEMLSDNHPADVDAGLGFDEVFSQLYPRFTKEERELFALIRSATKNSMHRVNNELRRWLDKNRAMIAGRQSDERWEAFAQELDQLRQHLDAWHDKYDALFASDESRSLVYLADEKRQGVGFPKKLEPLLEELLSR